MIYVLATDLVDATAFAGQTLEIKLRVQNSEARAITTAANVPPRILSTDQVWSTPKFEEALAAGDARRTLVARLVQQRGGLITKSYDVPETLDRENIEAWLALD